MKTKELRRFPGARHVVYEFYDSDGIRQKISISAHIENEYLNQDVTARPIYYEVTVDGVTYTREESIYRAVFYDIKYEDASEDCDGWAESPDAFRLRFNCWRCKEDLEYNEDEFLSHGNVVCNSCGAYAGDWND